MPGKDDSHKKLGLNLDTQQSFPTMSHSMKESPRRRITVTSSSKLIIHESAGRKGGVRPQSRQSAKRFLQSLKLGLPQPLTRMRVCPPPLIPGGGAHSLAREGVGESQFRRGDIHCGTLYKYVLCGGGVTQPAPNLFFLDRYLKTT